MIFAQFYQKSCISDEIIEATGDRSVVIIDGRLSNETIGKIAEKECIKRGYLAWSIFKGETFTRSKRLNSPNYVNIGNSKINDPFGLLNLG